jgi:hypothetical protein
MPGYAAIEEAGRTLRDLLRTELQGIDITGTEVVVELVSPGDITGTDVHLSLYLYRVEENASLKNAEPLVEADVTLPPPLVLDLYYLLSAHPTEQNPDSNDSYEQHRVLGRAMQVLYDNRVLRGAQPSGDDLHLSVEPQSTDELTGIWNTFEGRTYQPSVAYLVTPVVIESDRETHVGRVGERRVDLYVRSNDSPGADGGSP